jgi:hypothetical protein
MTEIEDDFNEKKIDKERFPPRRKKKVFGKNRGFLNHKVQRGP